MLEQSATYFCSPHLIRRVATVLSILLLNTPSMAATSQADSEPTTPPHQSITNVSTALQSAHQRQLASQTAWRRLLYYPEDSQHARPQSRVINRFNPPRNQQRFFISADGATNPTAELDSFITALFNADIHDDRSVQCRFPARSDWVIATLNIDPSMLPQATCHDLSDWMAKLHPTSASIIFASEYLDSPPSAFAHSFLRFDNSDPANQYYLNFTPRVTEGESFAKFAYQSTIAGNAGEFSITNYQQGIQDYLQRDGRNVWQYQLNLSQQQVTQLAYRTWEIHEQILPYYLLSDNCASEILVLLNSLLPTKNYLADSSPMVSPAQVVRILQRDKLIKTTDFSPSKYSIEQAAINRPVNRQPHTAFSQTNSHLTDITQRLATGFDPSSFNTTIRPSRDNPLLANPVSRFDIGGMQQSFNTPSTQPAIANHNAMILNYRMVYHDALDKTDGYPIGSQLTALRAQIGIKPNAKKSHDKLQLQHLGLFDVRSFHPINTAKQGISWGANLGLQRVFDGIKNDSNDHLVANVRGEIGKSYAFGQSSVSSSDMSANICYGLGSLAAQFGKGLYHGYRTGLGITMGCQAEFSPNWRAITELTLPYWVSGDSDNEQYWQPKFSIGSQYDINRENAFRLTVSREWLPKSKVIDSTDEVALKWLHYFE